MKNLSYQNEFDLHFNRFVSKTDFHMKGFALGLVLKQRQKGTRKSPIRDGVGSYVICVLYTVRIGRSFAEHCKPFL